MYKTINGRWGPVKFLLKDEYVGKSLYWYGEYNPDETEMILSLAPHGRLCLDIGANIGVISQALVACEYDVEAFEPQPELAKLVSENLGMLPHRKLGEYSVYNIALGAVDGVAKMPKVQYAAKGNFGGLGIGDKSIYGSYDVPVNTLDSFAYENVGFIKIDVEGYEYEVLCGAQETIARCKPIMYIEDDRVEKSRALRKMIDLLGYDIEDHRPTLYREKNFFGLQRNVWDKNYASHNLICRPKEY